MDRWASAEFRCQYTQQVDRASVGKRLEHNKINKPRGDFNIRAAATTYQHYGIRFIIRMLHIRVLERQQNTVSCLTVDISALVSIISRTMLHQ